MGKLEFEGYKATLSLEGYIGIRKR